MVMDIKRVAFGPVIRNLPKTSMELDMNLSFNAATRAEVALSLASQKCDILTHEVASTGLGSLISHYSVQGRFKAILLWPRQSCCGLGNPVVA